MCKRETYDTLKKLQDILNEPEEIPGARGGTLPRKLSVDYISFSAHVDYSQNSEFIEAVQAQHIVRHNSIRIPAVLIYLDTRFSYTASRRTWVA